MSRGEVPSTRGNSKSSVEERRDLRVSERLSENMELLLRLGCIPTSAKVAARLRGRWRIFDGDGLTCLMFWEGGGKLRFESFSEAIVREIQTEKKTWQN